MNGILSAGIPVKAQVEAAFPAFGWIDIVLKDCTLWIEPRPDYCDRGRYKVDVKTFDYSKMMIDGADFFPHYFFGVDAMLSEITAWARARKQI